MLTGKKRPKLFRLDHRTVSPRCSPSTTSASIFCARLIRGSSPSRTTVCLFQQPLSSWLRRPTGYKKGNQRLVGPHHRQFSRCSGPRTFATHPPFPQKLAAVSITFYPGLRHIYRWKNQPPRLRQLSIRQVVTELFELKCCIPGHRNRDFPFQMFLWASRSFHQSPPCGFYASLAQILPKR